MTETNPTSATSTTEDSNTTPTTPTPLESMPARQITQTDHLNKKLLESFLNRFPTMNIPVSEPLDSDDGDFEDDEKDLPSEEYLKQLRERFFATLRANSFDTGDNSDASNTGTSLNIDKLKLDANGNEVAKGDK